MPTSMQALYFKLLQSTPCAAVSLSGHDESPEGAAPVDYGPCFAIPELDVLFPLDREASPPYTQILQCI